MTRLTRSPLLWPLLALAALLLFNLVVNPGFFAVRIQDGHLFGSLVDVLKNAAPTLLIAIGMTLVIASRGIDIGAKAQIQQLVAQLAADGMSVVFVSAELEEVVRICDQVVVLRDRRKVAELDGATSSVDDVVDLIARGGRS